MTTPIKATLAAAAGLMVLLTSTACSGSPDRPGNQPAPTGAATSAMGRSPAAAAGCALEYSFGSPEDERWAKVALMGSDLGGFSGGSLSRSTQVTSLAGDCVDSSGAGSAVLPCPGTNGWPDGWGRDASGEVLHGWKVAEVKTSQLLITPENAAQRDVTQVQLVGEDGNSLDQIGLASWLQQCGAVSADDVTHPESLVYTQTGTGTVYYVFSPQKWDVKD